MYIYTQCIRSCSNAYVDCITVINSFLKIIRTHTECDGDLECLLIFLFEHSLELNVGDTERDGDLEALLLLFFEVTLELYLGDTECDGDLECLLLFLFELTL